jgi:hypothetical protein
MSEAPWQCPTCGHPVESPYCPTCGERPLAPHELTLRAILAHAWVAITSLDDRVLRTVRTLMTSPGALTEYYLSGPRKPYIGPFALFLLANLVFGAAEPFANSHAFSATLSNHLARQPWSAYAQELVAQRLQASHSTIAAYAPIFDAAVELHARSLVILMVLPFALLPPLLFYRSRRPFLVNVVFSLHFYAFVLAIFTLGLAVPVLDLALGGGGLRSRMLDDALSLSLLILVAVYLYGAIGRVYGATGWTRILRATIMAVAAASIVLGYRYLLFVTTLYATTMAS